MKLLLPALLATVTPLLAQFDTAEVLGTIRDNSGSVVGNASVTLVNEGTGFQVKRKTTDEGNYTFSNVKIGVYTVSAEASGFSKATATGVTVHVNARQRV